eukprot:COSAG06_NODE_14833_length_1122_cov_0.831867_1_plen_49_part_00
MSVMAAGDGLDRQAPQLLGERRLLLLLLLQPLQLYREQHWKESRGTSR